VSFSNLIKLKIRQSTTATSFAIYLWLQNFHFIPAQPHRFKTCFSLNTKGHKKLAMTENALAKLSPLLVGIIPREIDAASLIGMSSNPEVDNALVLANRGAALEEARVAASAIVSSLGMMEQLPCLGLSTPPVHRSLLFSHPHHAATSHDAHRFVKRLACDRQEPFLYSGPRPTSIAMLFFCRHCLVVHASHIFVVSQCRWT